MTSVTPARALAETRAITDVTTASAARIAITGDMDCTADIDAVSPYWRSHGLVETSRNTIATKNTIAPTDATIRTTRGAVSRSPFVSFLRLMSAIAAPTVVMKARSSNRPWTARLSAEDRRR